MKNVTKTLGKTKAESVGATETQSKKKWFSVCPNCGKKGYKQHRNFNYKTKVLSIWKECKYCTYGTEYNEVKDD